MQTREQQCLRRSKRGLLKTTIRMDPNQFFNSLQMRDTRTNYWEWKTRPWSQVYCGFFLEITPAYCHLATKAYDGFLKHVVLHLDPAQPFAPDYTIRPDSPSDEYNNIVIATHHKVANLFPPTLRLPCWLHQDMHEIRGPWRSWVEDDFRTGGDGREWARRTSGIMVGS